MSKNKQRAKRGYDVIQYYAELAGLHNDDVLTKVSDMIADVMHFLNTIEAEINWDDIIARSRMHFEAELAGDETGMLPKFEHELGTEQSEVTD